MPNKPELLAPGGSLEKLKIAIMYGADAVYIGGESFSLRVAAENFSSEEIKEGIEFAHQRDKKVYLTANIIPHNSDIDEFEKYTEEIKGYDFDGILVADPGMLDIISEKLPNIPIHISTQANNVNYRSALFWYKAGARRIVLAREMSLAEITEIRKRIPDDMEIEAFVHGAMCISYSGRCLLSNYMTGRDSNLGACAHPCRWKYSLVEETRPGEFMDVYENERGTFIFNSKDLCMIDHIPELVESGISSFKIEGRVKTSFYTATVVGAYRREIDKYFENPDTYKFSGEELEELCKVSHRPYCHGFYFGRPDGEGQVYTSSSYIRDYDLIAMVTDYDEETKTVTLAQRNKFSVGEHLELIQPQKPSTELVIDHMENGDGESIQSAPHAEMTVRFKYDTKIGEGAMLRRKSK